MLLRRRSSLSSTTLVGTVLVGALVAGGPAGAANDRDGAPWGAVPGASSAPDDPDARALEGGGYYYVEPQRPDAGGAPLPRARRAAADALTLHSLPGSDHTIFLDFDGHTVANTRWNEPDLGIPEKLFAGPDPAGNGPAFTPSELAWIHEIWEWVAEDFAPFDVDVTTEDPGPAAITRTGVNDPTYGARVLFTDDPAVSSSAACEGCFGVAHFDVFDETVDHAFWQVTWVLPGDNGAKAIADTVSHEVGHNLALEHDGKGGSEYYEPDIDDHQGWAPLMGISDHAPISTWSNGDYGGTNPQDDVAVIASSGAPLRADEAGSTIAGAAAFPTGTAYIAHRNDQDVYALGTCDGAVTIQAKPAPTGPNLDIELALLGPGGNVVTSSNPTSVAHDAGHATGLAADINGTVNTPGTYYVRVDGVGRGPAVTSYSDYGIVGAYSVTAAGCDLVPPTIEPERPERPTNTRAWPGPVGGARTAVIKWGPPPNAEAASVTGYQVRAFKIRNGRVVRKLTSGVLGAEVRRASFQLRGRWRFAVRAVNDLGDGPWSAKTTPVRTR